jgi:hypothetical protein
MQLIKIKDDFSSLNLVVFGGAGAPLVSALGQKMKYPG